MPFINGRFYMNPAYGRALERARSSESGNDGEPEEIAVRYLNSGGHGGQRQASKGKQEKESQTRIGNRVYNETGGLRSKAGAKPGEPSSAEDLHNGRVAIADVIQNREEVGKYNGVATNKIHKGATDTPQYRDAQNAASEAVRTPGEARGSENFYLDHGQPQPKWAEGKRKTSYGPFTNAAGGGDVPKGKDVRIVIVH